jgi:hypothetical protein
VQNISARTISKRSPIPRLHQFIERHFSQDALTSSTSVRTPAPVEPFGA